MPKGVVATMDTLGYVKEPTVKIDRLIAYWFANRIDQSIILTGIYSYQYVVARHQNDFQIDNFIKDMEESLRSYLLECFTGVEVVVRSPDYEPVKKMFTLAVSGQVEEDGKLYDLATSVSVNGKTFELIEKGRKEYAR